MSAALILHHSKPRQYSFFGINREYFFSINIDTNLILSLLIGKAACKKCVNPINYWLICLTYIFNNNIQLVFLFVTVDYRGLCSTSLLSACGTRGFVIFSAFALAAINASQHTRPNRYQDLRHEWDNFCPSRGNIS